MFVGTITQTQWDHGLLGKWVSKTIFHRPSARAEQQNIKDNTTHNVATGTKVSHKGKNFGRSESCKNI